MAPDTLFKESFALQQDSPDDFYKWSGLRYFLMNYEAELQPNKTIQIDKIRLSRSEGKTADYLSVEHLWATDNRNSVGKNNRKVDRFEKRRLGNFCLLELRFNIQGNNGGISEKITRYIEGSGDEQATDLAQVRRMAKDARNIYKDLENWTRTKNYYLEVHRRLNAKQEERYIKFAEKRWSIKNNLGYKYLQKLSRVEVEGDD